MRIIIPEGQPRITTNRFVCSEPGKELFQTVSGDLTNGIWLIKSGQIPKKLLHYAAREAILNPVSFRKGWETPWNYIEKVDPVFTFTGPVMVRKLPCYLLHNTRGNFYYQNFYINWLARNVKDFGGAISTEIKFGLSAMALMSGQETIGILCNVRS